MRERHRFGNQMEMAKYRNKKKDAFLNFVKDAGLVDEDKSLKGKEYKYIKYKPNKFAEKMFSLGVDDESMWLI